MPPVTLTIELAVPGTKDLTPPPVHIDVTIEMDADEQHERVKWDYFKKNFVKLMTEKLKAQVKHYAEPLASMQKDIDQLRESYHKITNATDIFALQAQVESANAIAKKADLDTRIKGYAKYLEDAVKNTGVQQVLIWQKKLELEAEKVAAKKIKDDIFWKKFRVTAGVVVKGLLVVAATAGAIIASVATLGGLPLALIAIGSVALALGEGVKVVKAAADVRNAWQLEKKTLDKVEKDLKQVADHLSKTSTKLQGLPKHMADATRFHSLRQATIKEKAAEVAALDAKIANVKKNLTILEKMDPVPSLAKAAKPYIAELEGQKAEASKAIRECMKNDERHSKLLAEAEELVGDLSKIDFTRATDVSLKMALAKVANDPSVAMNALSGLGKGSVAVAKALG